MKIIICKTCDPKPGKFIPVEGDIHDPVCSDCGNRLLGKMEKKKLDKDIKKLVLARLKAMSDDLVVSIG